MLRRADYYDACTHSLADAFANTAADLSSSNPIFVRNAPIVSFEPAARVDSPREMLDHSSVSSLTKRPSVGGAGQRLPPCARVSDDEMRASKLAHLDAIERAQHPCPQPSGLWASLRVIAGWLSLLTCTQVPPW